MRILFVCTGNSYRSPVAGALLKKVREDFDVESAGTHAAGMIASNACVHKYVSKLLYNSYK